MTIVASPPLYWPNKVLRPMQVMANQAAFTRGGGKSLTGLERVLRTDRGYWAIDLKGVPLKSVAQRRVWNAIRTALSGRAGILTVPVLSIDTAPWLPGSDGGYLTSVHADGSPFADDSTYGQSGIVVQMATAAAIGDTSVTLRLVYGIDDLSGARFSYDSGNGYHALYETGVPSEVDDDLWTVPVFPSIRAAIPADAALEFDMPRCLVRLATDRAMDVTLSPGGFDRVNVSFIEACDQWNFLATA